MKRLNFIAIGTSAARMSLTAHAQYSSTVTPYGVADVLVQGGLTSASSNNFAEFVAALRHTF